MQPGHDIPDDLADARLLFVRRFFVGSAECHEALGSFHLFGVKKWHVELGGNTLGNGIPGDRDGARENAVLLQEKQAGRTRAHVHHERAAIRLPLIVPHSITECHRRDVNHFGS